jgi:hypothetical protein
MRCCLKSKLKAKRQVHGSGEEHLHNKCKARLINYLEALGNFIGLNRKGYFFCLLNIKLKYDKNINRA